MTNFPDQAACCNVTADDFRQNWSREGNYLTEYLANMKLWGCPQFEKECRKPAFQFTKFTELVYLLNCNRSGFNLACNDVLQHVAPSGELHGLQLSDDELREPCVQVGGDPNCFNSLF